VKPKRKKEKKLNRNHLYPQISFCRFVWLVISMVNIFPKKKKKKRRERERKQATKTTPHTTREVIHPKISCVSHI